MSKTFLTSIKDTLLEEQNFARTETGLWATAHHWERTAGLKLRRVLPPEGDAPGDTGPILESLL